MKCLGQKDRLASADRSRVDGCQEDWQIGQVKKDVGDNWVSVGKVVRSGRLRKPWGSTR